MRHVSLSWLSSPQYCDLVALGGGWQKIEFLPGHSVRQQRNSATVTFSSYDLRTVGNFVRFTGGVQGSGDCVVGNQPLPKADECVPFHPAIAAAPPVARGHAAVSHHSHGGTAIT